MAYALLGVPDYGVAAAKALREADELLAPASVEAELLNVVWKWGRGRVSQETARVTFEYSTRLWTELLPVASIWPTALELAFASGHSPYDTLFVAAARLRQTKVLTYDEKMLSLFPNDTIRV